MNSTLRLVRKKCFFLASLFGVTLLLCTSLNLFHMLYTEGSANNFSISVTIERNRTSMNNGYQNNAVSGRARDTLQRDEISFKRIRDLIRCPVGYFSGDNTTMKEHRSPYTGESQIIDQALGKMKHGRFVEIYSGDDVGDSPTLMLEKARNWSGILIYSNRNYFQKLLRTGRNILSLNACIKIRPDDTEAQHGSVVNSSQIPCFRIDSILHAVDYTAVHLLVLDAKWKEIDILQSFPFADVGVSMVSIKFHGVNFDTADIVTSLARRGFSVLHVLTHHPLNKTVLIFSNKSQ